MFQPGANEQCVMVSIVSDATLENMEVFSVQLNTTDQSVVFFTTSTATVSILDDDSEYSNTIYKPEVYYSLSDMKINTKQILYSLICVLHDT